MLSVTNLEKEGGLAHQMTTPRSTLTRMEDWKSLHGYWTTLMKRQGGRSNPYLTSNDMHVSSVVHGYK